MITKTKSDHAAAAAIIRARLKVQGIKARVTSRTFSMGDAVDVTILQDVLPATLKAISDYVNEFEYGHFDGMTDSYHYSNKRADIPQVKYAHVNCDYSDALRAEVRAFVAAKCGSTVDLDRAAWQVINGSQDLGFWNSRKPRVRLQVKA